MIPARKNRGDEKGRHGHSHFLRKRVAQENKQHAGDNPSGDEAAAHVIGPVLEIAALHQRVENVVLDAGDVLVKHVLQAGKIHIGLRAVGKNSARATPSRALSSRPIPQAFFSYEKHSPWCAAAFPRFLTFSFSSITIYPRTARSTIVAVMSRMAACSSTSVPASAGVIPSGGAYCTATEPMRGSRPRVDHSQNMNRNTGMGNKIGQLLSRN